MKLFKYDKLTIKLSLLIAYLMVWGKRTKFTVAGNNESKDSGSINYVQSSLKSLPLWVTLYFKLFILNIRFFKTMSNIDSGRS